MDNSGFNGTFEVKLQSFINFLVQEISSQVVNNLEIKSERKDLSHQNSASNHDQLLTINETAKKLKVTRGTLYNWRRDGYLLPDTFVGNSPRYKAISLERFLSNN